MRGVHAVRVCDAMDDGGSSPHARGPLSQRGAEDGHHRIIPACAGSTFRLQQVEHLAEDHPRMRGVHLSQGPPSSLHPGSSPHARGPLIGFFGAISLLRIIPACAGSTGGQYHRAPDGQDHPRMRGVHRPGVRTAGWCRGSSPHARGPHLLYHPGDAPPRIIPACAGSTLTEKQTKFVD